jgi:hypothetical protein
MDGRSGAQGKAGKQRPFSLHVFRTSEEWRLYFHELTLASCSDVMNAVLVIHAAVTWALVGVIWMTQIVQYPLWSQIGREAFCEYHARHMLRMTLIVAPLVITEFVTAAALVVCGAREAWLLASFVLMVFNWISTFLVQVPLHAKLAMGFDLETHRRLLSSNWWRTAGWTIRGICLVVVLVAR